MQRIYNHLIQQHFSENKQMILLAGPRQVGKTTLYELLAENNLPVDYLNWDRDKDRNLILQGQDAVAAHINIETIQSEQPYLFLDEIHKYPRWKNFLKGFYDSYAKRAHIVVTGSAKLNVYRKNSDSLVGRYFLYRVHPLSLAEILQPELSQQLIRMPKQSSTEDIGTLLKFGGFPEPFLKQNTNFSRQWNRTRYELLFREDIRDLSHIQEITQLEILAKLLQSQVGGLVNMSNLANKIQVSVNTIKRWLETLSNFYFCFLIRPWTKNVTRSLLKDPKIYLLNWSDVEDVGARYENFIASHLLKAVNFWTDSGFGEFELHFIRDKEKREVDFLVVRDHQPWFLVEAKFSSGEPVSNSLKHFHQSLKTKHAFQVVFDMEYVDKNCFEINEPVKVPAATFLSQLV